MLVIYPEARESSSRRTNAAAWRPWRRRPAGRRALPPACLLLARQARRSEGRDHAVNAHGTRLTARRQPWVSGWCRSSGGGSAAAR